MTWVITWTFDFGDGVCIGEKHLRHTSHLTPHTSHQTMTNTELTFDQELTLDQLKNCSGGWYLPAAYIIAKEGAKAVQFYMDLGDNLSEGKNLGAAVAAAGHSSGTI